VPDLFYHSCSAKEIKLKRHFKHMRISAVNMRLDLLREQITFVRRKWAFIPSKRFCKKGRNA
jgi:hypothetical protein